MSSKIVYKKINVQIKGLTPLLMNRLNPESLKSKTRMRTEEYSTEKDAANSAYVTDVNGNKELYVPQECLYSMIIGTAKQYKLKRMSLASMLAGTMRIEPEKVLLGRKAIAIDPVKEPAKAETEGYVIDERAVVIQTQRVLKGRAKLKNWTITFQIVYDAIHLPEGIFGTLKEILEDAGTRMGLLDYRPQHKGWFGTFVVTKFEAVEVPAEQQVVIEESPLAHEHEEPTAETAEPKRRGRPKKAPT